AHAIDESEDALVTGAREAMNALSRQFDSARPSGWSVDEEFDLVFNPFPAEIFIHTPRPVSILEGFTKKGEDTAVIRRSGLNDAIRALEGKWLTPDPLAMLLRTDQDNTEMPADRELA